MLQAAPSFDKPRPISLLGGAGRPGRLCFRHGRDADHPVIASHKLRHIVLSKVLRTNLTCSCSIILPLTKKLDFSSDHDSGVPRGASARRQGVKLTRGSPPPTQAWPGLAWRTEGEKENQQGWRCETGRGVPRVRLGLGHSRKSRMSQSVQSLPQHQSPPWPNHGTRSFPVTDDQKVRGVCASVPRSGPAVGLSL